MLPLEEEIYTLSRFGALREEALDLLTGGLHGLGGTPYDQHECWEVPRHDGARVEHALVLQALRVATERGLTPDARAFPPHHTVLGFLTAVSPQSLIALEPGRAPVLLSARGLEALATLPGFALSRASVTFLYRVLRELFSSEPPLWAMGSARAGQGCRATAFVTGECCRGIVTFSRAFTGAAIACAKLRDAQLRRAALALPSQVPALWVSVELARVQEALEIDMIWLRGRTIFRFDDTNVEDLHEVASRLGAQVDMMCRQVDEARRAITEARARETAGLGPSESPHRAAMSALDELLERLKNVAASLTMADWELSRVRLEGIAKALNEHLDPSRNFIVGVLDHELAAAAVQNSDRDLPELAFAAAAHGMLQDDWADPRLDRAAEVLVANVNDGGRLPTGQPFQVQATGFRLHAAGAEVIRGLGALLREKPCSITPKLVTSFVRLLRTTKRDVPDGIGWCSEVTTDPRKASWWASALSILALDRIVRMLDNCLNERVMAHFSTTDPAHLQVSLDTTFYPDYGLTRPDRPSVAIHLQRMRAHALGIPRSAYPACLCSIVLYGPPGTGKTTLAEALARSVHKRFIQITPSDIVLGGAEHAEHRARVVFEALTMLTDTVILFDEFDPLLRRRMTDGRVPSTIFELLTPGMLPKLAKLHDAAREQRVAYVLATNLVGSLDDAAIRDGRFDEKVGVYPPDLTSRLGRLLSVKQPLTPDQERRLIQVCAMTHDSPMSTLGRKGWFTADVRPRDGTGQAYVDDETKPPRWPTPEFPEIRRSGEGKHADLELAEWLWTRMSDWHMVGGPPRPYGGDLQEYLDSIGWADLRRELNGRVVTWGDITAALQARPEWGQYFRWILCELRRGALSSPPSSAPKLPSEPRLQVPVVNP
ncbi:MAG: AAA family ATPase [Polyangiaceae bacterium]